MWTPHQDKRCSRQLASCSYCEWPTVLLFQGSSNQQVRGFHRDTGNTEPPPKSFSYKNHNECLPSLRPIFFKSVCCVFESFNLVDMNIVASSTRQWTWVSVGLFYMDKHRLWTSRQTFHMKPVLFLVGVFFFFLPSSPPLWFLAGDWIVYSFMLRPDAAAVTTAL